MKCMLLQAVCFSTEFTWQHRFPSFTQHPAVCSSLASKITNVSNASDTGIRNLKRASIKKKNVTCGMSTCVLIHSIEPFKMKCFHLDYIIDDNIYHLFWKYEILLIWREKNTAIFFFTYLLILMFCCWDLVLHVRYIAIYFVFRKKTDLVLNYVPK